MEWLFYIRDYSLYLTQNWVAILPLEKKWDAILEFFNNDERLVLGIGTILTLVFSYLITNLFFVSLDLFGKPSILMKYKIQKDKNIPVDKNRYLSCVKCSIQNKLLTCSAVVLLCPVMQWRGISCQRPLPGIGKFVMDILLCMLMNEPLFYYGHRMMHLSIFYKRFHKKHHEWVAPVSWAAIYQHPVDHLISHLVPLLVPPIVVGSHALTTWAWLMTFQMETAMHHSNYHVPFFSSPQFHDYHHLKFNENYGSLGWLDYLHDTSKSYRKSIQAKRNIILYDTEPVSQKFPSTNPKEN